MLLMKELHKAVGHGNLTNLQPGDGIHMQSAQSLLRVIQYKVVQYKVPLLLCVTAQGVRDWKRTQQASVTLSKLV